MDKSLLESINSLPDRKEGAHATVWTKEMDDALLAGWGRKNQRDVCQILGLSLNTCRERYRRLTSVQGM